MLCHICADLVHIQQTTYFLRHKEAKPLWHNILGALDEHMVSFIEKPSTIHYKGFAKSNEAKHSGNVQFLQSLENCVHDILLDSFLWSF